MKKNILMVTTLAISGLFTTAANAANLIDVFHKAFLNDPQFKAANAQWLADRENLPLSIATLLPQIDATTTLTRGRGQNENSGTGAVGTTFENSTDFSLTLKQSVFNFGSWANVWGTQAAVKGYEATFLAAIEDVMIRSATAYFAVLQAEDILRFDQSYKTAVGSILEQTQHKYEVGLIAITDLEDARASYDQAIANEIADSNDLANKFEQLKEITGIKYSTLDHLITELPLINPQPYSRDTWVQAAEKQNYNLATARYNALAAKENIKVKNAGHLPTISGALNYDRGYSRYNPDFSGLSSRDKTASATIALNVPLFSGGSAVAAAKQANYQYQVATAAQEQTHRSVVSATNQAYNNILALISKVKADQQSVKSSQSKLRSTQAGYSAGTRTMVEVLQAQSGLFQVQKTLALDEYQYLIATLTLKQVAGILDIDDLKQINSWLTSTPRKPDNTTESTIAKFATKQEATESNITATDNANINQAMKAIPDVSKKLTSQASPISNVSGTTTTAQPATPQSIPTTADSGNALAVTTASLNEAVITNAINTSANATTVDNNSTTTTPATNITATITATNNNSTTQK